ncbi:hypothetical protein BDP27DRAFT_1215337 [Rhodocollybia butyracea]|uniref:Copper acquisition factor BIM1-like domain-containing protein n=1 Tax=Rhodocollybia butyracea TaxID=206335 RepID=A0A9P5Q342_9AGAR|nr:hypothetical protein BDP27DRAFT_1215337 [Rhodocollybia butyracea]
MHSFTALFLSGLFAVVNAHFQLQFPPPRGVFNMANEVNFCDSYTTPAPNRTDFPLTGGIISLNSEHPQWTAAVFISNASNPTSFDNFTQITSFFQESIEGSYCMHFDLSQTNATGLTNGENILFNGGDGNLFQCADLTIDTTADVSSQACTNATSGALGLSGPAAGSLFGLAGLAFALL